MKVLHLGCPYLPYKGGSTKRLMNLAKHIIAEGGVQQYLITPSSGEESDARFFKKTLRTTSVNKFSFNKEIYHFVKQVSPNVIVVHNSRALLKWILFYRCFFSNVKIIVEIHSIRDESFFKKKLNQLLYSMSDMLVHLSIASHEYMTKEYGQYPSSVIYNGIEAARNNQSQKDYNSSNTAYAYVGSFHKWQGVNLIAKSAVEIGESYWKQNKLILIGSGPEFQSVEKALSKLVASGCNIELYGWKDEAYIESILNDVDFLLAPRPSSIATETVLPLKITDSIKYLKPLICSNVAGLMEITADENAAFYFDKSDELGLVNFWLNKPSKEEYKCVLSALEGLNNRFSTWQESARLYCEVYRSLL